MWDILFNLLPTVGSLAVGLLSATGSIITSIPTKTHTVAKKTHPKHIRKAHKKRHVHVDVDIESQS